MKKESQLWVGFFLILVGVPLVLSVVVGSCMFQRVDEKRAESASPVEAAP